MANGLRSNKHITWNVLGASHTDPVDGNAFGKWLKSYTRMTYFAAVIMFRRPDTISLQEFQPLQAKRFRVLLGVFYGFYVVGDNAVAWKRTSHRLAAKQRIQIPYFYGNLKAMPVALLRPRRTKARLVVTSVHNPANVRGEASQWRRKGWEIEGDTVTHNIDLQRHRGHPTSAIRAGDRNASGVNYRPFCVKYGFRLISGSISLRDIDHIDVSDGVVVGRVEELDSPRIRKVSDHKPILSVTLHKVRTTGRETEQ